MKKQLGNLTIHSISPLLCRILKRVCMKSATQTAPTNATVFARLFRIQHLINTHEFFYVDNPSSIVTHLYVQARFPMKLQNFSQLRRLTHL